MAWDFSRVAGPFQGPLGGLAWNGERLLVAAVLESRILSLDPQSGSIDEFRRYTNRTSGLALGPRGEVYGCQEGSRRIIEFLPDGSARITASTLDGKYHNFPSDLCVDGSGRIWFSDPFNMKPALGPQIFPQLEHASVLRLARAANHRWQIRRTTYDTRVPRSVLVSSDEKTLFVAEGDTSVKCRELRAYLIEADDTLGNPSVLVTFGKDHRGPHRGIEGMCLDSEGNIVACGGWKRSGPGPVVYVINPTGVILESHPFPEDLPMRCAFGGRNLDTLYVTTGLGNLYQAKLKGRTGFKRFPAKGH